MKKNINSLLSLVIGEGVEEKAAEHLGHHLQIEIVSEALAKDLDALFLRLDENGLALTHQGMILRGDFSLNKKRIHPHTLSRELLVKACKINGTSKGLTVVDATAGMGEDSFLLAAAGFQVEMIEKDRVIAALLVDALKRAVGDDDIKIVIDRMKLTEGDSIALLPKLTPDVVYLDPMFPERKKSAAVKKKFQLLHCLESPCDDEEALLGAAYAAHPKKIVIKRPIHAPDLGQIKPTYSIKGKTIRYDCIVL